MPTHMSYLMYETYHYGNHNNDFASKNRKLIVIFSSLYALYEHESSTEWKSKGKCTYTQNNKKTTKIRRNKSIMNY